MPNHDKPLRQHLISLLEGGHAHATFDAIIANVPASSAAKNPLAIPTPSGCFSNTCAWRNGTFSNSAATRRYLSAQWPDDYWPKTAAPPTPAAWNASIKKFRADLKAMQALVRIRRTDLFAKIPWGDGQTILREACSIADHNSHHLGQMLDVRRLLGAWPMEELHPDESDPAASPATASQGSRDHCSRATLRQSPAPASHPSHRTNLLVDAAPRQTSPPDAHASTNPSPRPTPSYAPAGNQSRSTISRILNGRSPPPPGRISIRLPARSINSAINSTPFRHRILLPAGKNPRDLQYPPTAPAP